MGSGNLRKAFMLAASATLVASSFATPALAGGGHGRGGHYGYGHGPGYYSYGWNGAPHHGYWRDYGGRHYYRYDRHGLSGAEAGLIAAGIVGAAILIDGANDRGRDRYYDDRYYRDGYDGDRYYDSYGRYDDRRSGGDFYYRRDDRRVSERDWEDASGDRLERSLAGNVGGGGRGEYNFGAAYNDCKAEARQAADGEGLTVGLPARPDRIERLEGGAAVRFVTQFRVDERGRSDRQTMVCEADADGVRFLELV